MSLLTMERLRTPRAAVRTLAHWGSADPWVAAGLVCDQVVGAGSRLPLVWMVDGVVAPVVVWDREVLAGRLASGRGPLPIRSVLNDRLIHGRDHEAPSPLRMEAFIAVQPIRRAVRTMAWLSGVAQVAAAVPAAAPVPSWAAFECDYYGFTIAQVGDARAEVVVRGRTCGKGAHLPVGHQVRLMQEQLFDVAVRTGTLPRV